MPPSLHQHFSNTPTLCPNITIAVAFVEMYTYTPLCDRQIRVAILHPGRFDDEITVSFDVADFAPKERPQYEALSYVWGIQKSPPYLSPNLSHSLFK